jgi:hypothetical protein
MAVSSSGDYNPSPSSETCKESVSVLTADEIPNCCLAIILLLNVAIYLKYTSICRHSVRTSQETHYITVTEPTQLILFGETVAVCCENRTEHTDTLLMPVNAM